MKSLLVDTNAYSAFAAGNKDVDAIFRSHDRIILPFIALGELFVGFKLGTREEQNREQLVRFLSMQVSEVLYADPRTPEHYAAIAIELRRKGRPIPTNDIWIAALVRQHHYPLCTNDKDFEAIEGLAILKFKM